MAIENRSSELEAELNELRQTLAVQAEQSRELQSLQESQASRINIVEKKLQDESELNRANLQTIQMLQSKLRQANQSLSESESGFVELKARLTASENDKDALTRRLMDLEN